jgi:hypothetical protein
MAETGPDNKIRPRCNAAGSSLIGVKWQRPKSDYG